MKPGTSIGGKYRLTRQLGSGAMGVVWAAVHEGLAREVAIKLILQPSAELRIRMMREARACGALKHPNIVEVLDVDQTADGDPYLVMQLLSGETLGELLQRQRRLDSAQAAHIAQDVARALVAAHAAGIVHRDLKPANVFLHDQIGQGDVPVRVVKVLDFGVSKNIVGEADGLATVTGGMVGSPAYMSPEQSQAKRDIDYRSDLWSLGIVLFEMLTGKRPFAGEAGQILAKINLERAPSVTQFVRHADPGLAQIVSQCLERDLARRVQTAAQLVEMLAPYCGGLGGPGPRISGDASTLGGETPRPAPVTFFPDASRPPPQPSRPELPRAGTDDDEDAIPTARLDPRMLGKVAMAPRPATSAPVAEARVVVAPAGPPSATALPSATVPLNSPVPASHALAKKTMPLGDGTVKAPTFRPPAPSGGDIAPRGTVRMSPEHMSQVPSPAASVTAPLPVLSAPPVPSADGSGGWPASSAFNPPSSSSNPHVSFNPPSSSSNPSLGSVTTPLPMTPLDSGSAALTAPMRPPNAGQAPFDSGAAALAPPPRRKLGLIVVSAVVVAAFAILTVALLHRLSAPSMGAAPSATASTFPVADASATASDAAAPVAPLPADAGSDSAGTPATAVMQTAAGTASSKPARPMGDPYANIRTVPVPSAQKKAKSLIIRDPWGNK